MACETNLEAAREVARQLRLRDLGGLVVVDFIDLRSTKNKKAVEKTMKDSLKSDRARSTVGRLSPNGLLEINRQRIQQALRVRAQRACPTCQGTGRVPSIETIGLNLLRRIEGRAATGRLLKARVEMHAEIAEAVQNGRRRDFARLEQEFDIEIEIVASHRLHGPEEQIEWRDRPTPIQVPPLRAAQIRERRTQGPAAAPVVFEPSPESGAEEQQPAGVEGEAAAASEIRGDRKKRRRRGGRNRKRRGEGAASPVLPSEMPILFAAGDAPADDAGEGEDPPMPESNETPRLSGAARGGEDGRRNRRRGGRNRRGRHGDRGPGGGPAGGNDGGPERGNVDKSAPGDGPRESVEERIARIAAAFAPSI